MFERYNDRARRALFFARYEVAQTGGLSIEPEHLVLGVLRDWADAVLRFAGAGESEQTIRGRIDPLLSTGERVSTSVEIPFSDQCKHALQGAAIEADSLGNHWIRPEHLILGVMATADGPTTRALRDAGVDVNAIRDYLRNAPEEPYAPPPKSQSQQQGMVVRQWTGIVKSGKADDYVAHLQRETLPALARIAGFVSASILKREVDEGTEFQVVSVWRSLDAIKAFAGDDVTRAVVPPAAQALMVRYDDRAIHYDIVQ